MANHYLKTASGLRVYRLEYDVLAGPKYEVTGAFVSATGADAVLPNGVAVTRFDQQVSPSQVIVDLVLGNVAVGTVADYRTAAKAMIDTSW